MFGLSAFAFSILGHTLFPGDTASLLLTLSIGTSLPMVLGFFFVRPIPLPSDHEEHGSESPTEQDSHTPLLAGHEASEHLEGGDNNSGANANLKPLPTDPSHSSVLSDYTSRGSPNSTPLIRVPSTSSPRERPSVVQKSKTVDPKIRGMGLAMSVDFWLLFTTTVLRENHVSLFICNK